MTEESAFEIEAALIDFVGMNNLSNLQGCHYSADYVLTTSDEISAMYEADKLETDFPAILINISKLYKREMTGEELYEATRKAWVIGERRKRARYTIATYRGLTREVFQIDYWYPIDRDGKTRWGFHGELADEAIRFKLRYKSISSYFLKGAANPIKYLNC